jgi:uncharacterized membrane protein (UPF0127 family)
MHTPPCSRTARWVAAATVAFVLAGCGDDAPDTAAPLPDDDGAAGIQPADDAGDAPTGGADDGSMAADGGEMFAEDGQSPDGDLPADDGPTADAPDGEVAPLLAVIDGWPETTVTLDGDEPTTVAAKVADRPERRQQGLMNVEELPDDVGMLFLFDDLRSGGFWMKNTLVPLDIAYLADGEVVSVLQMDPCETDPCPSYDPDVEYDAALEVNQGALADAGVDVGTAVSWDPPTETAAP